MARRQTRKMRCAWREIRNQHEYERRVLLEVSAWVIKSGKVTMEELDDAARHVLTLNMIWDCLTTHTAIWGRKS